MLLLKNMWEMSAIDRSIGEWAEVEFEALRKYSAWIITRYDREKFVNVFSNVRKPCILLSKAYLCKKLKKISCMSNEKYPKQKNQVEIEQEILAFWEANAIFKKSITERKGAKSFVFYEGPPSANGMPGIHHVMARTIKDIFCRYKTQEGHQVLRKAGWDTHGLPIELQVEKELSKELGKPFSKDDIGKEISVQAYNQKCRDTVMKYTSEWEAMTKAMGYWVDMQNPYITYKNEYIESVWHLLKKLYDKKVTITNAEGKEEEVRTLYKGYTIQPYSPKAGTGLSSHELNQPGCYKEVTDTTITAQFKVKYDEKSTFLFSSEGGAGKEDVRILAWTTTPWTLPANCALAVGEKITYLKVKTFNPYTGEPVSVILAKDRLEAYFSPKNEVTDDSLSGLEAFQKGDKKIPYRIAGAYAGKDLLEVRYEQLMPYVTNEGLKKNAFRVIAGDFVTTEDGTGVVHTASVFGADDFRVANQNGVPPVLVLDEEGNQTPLVTKQGKFVPQLRDGLNKDLKEVAKGLGKSASEYTLPAYMKQEYEETKLREGYLPSDVLISILLKEQNKAFKVEKYVHNYPHCWRTDKPILYYPLDSWFVRTTAMKDKMVELNKTINWKPESTGTGRFGNWLENLVDWNLSRQRYWGIPLPIWRTEDGKEEFCAGSIEEIVAKIEEALENKKALTKKQVDKNIIFVKHFKNRKKEPEKFDIHRPYIDQVTLISPTGKQMLREKDLIDVWFDSGAMPYAQQHYPFAGELSNFPADFISEGVDQTRGWFFTLHAIGAMLFDSVAFKNVVSTGLVLDKNGEKMSKRKGNVVEPLTVTKKAVILLGKNEKGEAITEETPTEYEVEGALSKYGADATRWYMISNSNPWDNLKFSWESKVDHAQKKISAQSDGIEEVQRRFFGTLRNTYSFYALYANLDKFTYSEPEIALSERTESDRWILSRLNSLVKDVRTALDDYEPTKAARAIQEFTNDDLSNWYVRLNRKRFWKSEIQADKISAYQTLYACLETIAKLMAPIAPFYAERLFSDLNGVTKRDKNISVHLTAFPAVQPNAIDQDLEEKMHLAQTISSLTHSIRKKLNIRVRQPLSKIILPISDKKTMEQVSHVADIIKDEVNVKAIEFLSDDSGIVVKSVKPNFKTLGAKYKQQMKEVQNAVLLLNREEIAVIERGGSVGKGGFELVLEDVLVASEEVEGLSVASQDTITVALDVTITPALRKEGIARDFVNRIQNYRKDSNFEVQDKIKIVASNQFAEIVEALTAFSAYICTETQALDLAYATTVEGQVFEIEEFAFEVKIEKV